WPRLRLFDDEGGGWAMPSISAPVQVRETDQGYEVTCEVPGMEEKDLEVTVAGDRLTIRGEKRAEKDEKRAGYMLSERRYGSFQRSVRLPDDVDPEKIAATLRNGVLTLDLPRSAEARQKVRRVEVKRS